VSLESEVTEPGFRLTALSDMSVWGKPRWWASMAAPAPAGNLSLGLLSAFCEASDPLAAVLGAKAKLKRKLAEPVPSLEDLLG
jgi:hypothetical protein